MNPLIPSPPPPGCCIEGATAVPDVNKPLRIARSHTPAMARVFSVKSGGESLLSLSELMLSDDRLAATLPPPCLTTASQILAISLVFSVKEMFDAADPLSSLLSSDDNMAARAGLAGGPPLTAANHIFAIATVFSFASSSTTPAPSLSDESSDDISSRTMRGAGAKPPDRTACSQIRAISSVRGLMLDLSGGEPSPSLPLSSSSLNSKGGARATTIPILSLTSASHILAIKRVPLLSCLNPGASSALVSLSSEISPPSAIRGRMTLPAWKRAPSGAEGARGSPRPASQGKAGCCKSPSPNMLASRDRGVITLASC
mmetsp:Transcript_848/g.1594  ORF Transcript_848/g.1594 Transcript_848/m.1594 type:complete len:315 (-) Transcript_848:1657-2601(-)